MPTSEDSSHISSPDSTLVQKCIPCCQTTVVVATGNLLIARRGTYAGASVAARFAAPERFPSGARDR